METNTNKNKNTYTNIEDGDKERELEELRRQEMAAFGVSSNGRRRNSLIQRTPARRERGGLRRPPTRLLVRRRWCPL